MASKNSTRIASLLGTWTGQTHLKTEIGSYELEAYFVVHFMPDPMKEYSCSLDGCSEVENHACMLNKKGDGACEDLSETVLNWSDVSAFMYFGAKIDVGFPFNKHRSQDTGNWVGPMNVIMAQKDIDSESEADVVDSYVSRFVETPLTEFIQMPKNCSLLREEDFNKIAGAEAVRQTAKGQYDSSGKDSDPYEKYMNTCKHGDVKPLLPLFQFDFVQDKDTKEESVEVKLDYKLMSMPRKKDYMYNIFPEIKNKVNALGLGFHISGPYCYGGDPKRGYSFDMDIDTRHPKMMLKLEHDCMEGLPCVPPAADLYVHSANSNIDVKPMPDDAVALNIGPTIFFIISTTIFIGIILYLFRANRNLKTRLMAGSEIGNDVNENGDNLDGDDGDRVLIPYESMVDSESPEETQQLIAEGETEMLIQTAEGLPDEENH